VSAAATFRFQTRTTNAILAGLTAGTVTVHASAGVVTLWSPTVVWGTDQCAVAELSRDCDAIRARGGPWVRLSAEQGRMARMARQVALAADATAVKKAGAAKSAAHALIGTVVTFADAAPYGCSTPTSTQWLVTHMQGSFPVAEPVDLTDEQRNSRELLARRFEITATGPVVLDKTTCLAYEKGCAAGALIRR